MMQTNPKPAWSRGLDRTAAALNWVAAGCLLMVVAVVATGVVMRFALAMPLMGVNEIVQLAAVALVMAALPLCTVRNAHVGVDVFDRAIGRWGRFVGDVLSRSLSIFVLAVLALRALAKAADALEWGDATNMLGLPIWPFYGMLGIGAALCALVYLAQLGVILRQEVRS